MADAYEVAIRLRLIDQVSRSLLGMVGGFGKADAAAVALQRRLDGIKRTMLVGGLLVGAGVGIFAALKPALDQAKQFQQEVTKFSLYGMGDQANTEAVKFAKSMNIMGSSYVDNMKLMTEAQGIFRESGKGTLAQQLEGAKIAAPVLAKLGFIESSLSDDQKASRHAQDLAMLRFIEARGGANDPRIFTSIADWGFKLQQSAGGHVVNWSQLQQLIATAGAAGFNLNQDAISKLEPVIADLKGGKVGSGMRVSFQRLLGTQRGLPKQAIQEYLSLGLWDPSKVELSAQGGIKKFLGRPGDVLKDRVKFGTDPVAFYTDTFLPAIAKKYGNQILGTTPEAKIERAAEITNVFGPGTAGAFFSQIDKLLPAIQRSLGAQNKQAGIDASYKAAGDTLAGKELALHAKFNSLLEQTGEVVLPIAIKAMEAMMPVLNFFSNFATAHPRMFGFVIDGLMALGASLIVSGVATGLTGLVNLIGLLGKAFAGDAILKAGVWATKIPFIGTALSEGLVAIGAGLETGTAAVGNAVARLSAIQFTGGLLGISGVLGALAISVDQIRQNSSDVSSKDPRRQTLGWINQVMSALPGGLIAEWANRMSGLDKLILNWNPGKSVLANVSAGLDGLWSRIQAFASKLPGLIPTKPQSITPPGMTLAQAAHQNADIANQNAMVSKVNDWLYYTLVKPIGDFFTGFGTGIANGLHSALAGALAQWRMFGDGLSDMLHSLFPTLFKTTAQVRAESALAHKARALDESHQAISGAAQARKNLLAVRAFEAKNPNWTKHPEWFSPAFVAARKGVFGPAPPQVKTPAYNAGLDLAKTMGVGTQLRLMQALIGRRPKALPEPKSAAIIRLPIAPHQPPLPLAKRPMIPTAPRIPAPVLRLAVSPAPLVLRPAASSPARQSAFVARLIAPPHRAPVALQPKAMPRGPGAVRRPVDDNRASVTPAAIYTALTGPLDRLMKSVAKAAAPSLPKPAGHTALNVVPLFPTGRPPAPHAAQTTTVMSLLTRFGRLMESFSKPSMASKAPVKAAPSLWTMLGVGSPHGLTHAMGLDTLGSVFTKTTADQTRSASGLVKSNHDLATAINGLSRTVSASGTAFVRPAAQAPVHVHVNSPIHLDGKKIGRWAADYLVGGSNTPQEGSSYADPSATMLQVATRYSA